LSDAANLLSLHGHEAVDSTTPICHSLYSEVIVFSKRRGYGASN